MGKGSASASVGKAFARAEAELRRRTPGALQFASVRHALRFMFERGPAMQGALTHHPRGHLLPDGSTAIVAVDGGLGSTIDEVLSVLQTVHDACSALRTADPQAHELLVLHVRDGLGMVELGKHSGLAPSTCGAKVARGEWFLLGRLQGEVVLAQAGRAP